MKHIVISSMKGKGTVPDTYKYNYTYSMTTLCDDDNELRVAGLVFVDTVSRLIGLILGYRSVQGDSSHRGKRMGYMLNLLLSDNRTTLI